jgi:Helix-turn-helix.
MDVYHRIDELLRKKGVSRRKAAQMAEIPPTTLSGALYRKKGLSAAAVSALARVLDVDANYLLTGEIHESIVMGATLGGSARGATDIAIAKQHMNEDFDTLNPNGKREAAKRVHELTQIDEYMG